MLFLCLIYTLNIRKTLKYKQQYQQNTASVQRAATATQDIANYEAQLASLQSTALQAYDREQLLSAITDFCKLKELLIKTFPEPRKIIENEQTIVTNVLEVEGTYKALVELIYQIEQVEKLAAISSVRFFMHKDRLTRREALRCHLILRNLEETP